jgi:hypothetical protein
LRETVSHIHSYKIALTRLGCPMRTKTLCSGLSGFGSHLSLKVSHIGTILYEVDKWFMDDGF